jgi:preprotein translocase subunit SecE
MAQIFRKQPTAAPTPTPTKTRPATTGGPTGKTTGMGRLRGNIDTVLSEVRKVTWPTREETRNLTIVVIGISVALGLFLGGIDFILGWVYTLLAH